MSIRSFYSTAATYLTERLPLENELLSNLTFLHPPLARESAAVKGVEGITHKLPCVPDEDVINIANELKAFQARCSTVLQCIMEASELTYIGGFVLDMDNDKEKKDLALLKLKKSGLILPHGNTNVERSFLITNNIITAERTALTTETINALLTAKDALKFYDP